MNISAINCTPIKPQTSFKSNDGWDDCRGFDELEQITDKLNDEFVHSSTVKKPLAVVATVAIATALAFGGGKKIAYSVKEFVNKLLSTEKNPIDITDPKCAKYFEKPLKEFSTSLQEKATKLQSGEGKLPKFKKVVGMILEKVEDTARTTYKKVANIGVKEGLTPEQLGTKKFENLGGAIGVGTFVPAFSAKDNDDNGVADASETTQSAYNPNSGKGPSYDNTKGRLTKALEGVSVVGEILANLT